MAPTESNGHHPPELPPVRLEVGFSGSGASGRVVLTEYGPLSQHIITLGAEQAEAIAQSILTAASRVRSGLLLPDSPG